MHPKIVVYSLAHSAFQPLAPQSSTSDEQSNGLNEATKEMPKGQCLLVVFRLVGIIVGRPVSR